MQQQPSVEYRAETETNVGTAVTKRGRAGVSKRMIVIVVAVVVLGSGSIGAALALHVFGPPHPVMNVTSSYKVYGRLVGASSTMLHVSGQDFATNSAITFLLDNKPIKVGPKVQSDGNGNIDIDLPITVAWSIGQHTVKARDANNDVTNSGTVVTIVKPGQEGTPGPNGAPTDSASFTIQLTVQAHLETSNTVIHYPYTLVVTGHPDPQGGTVCSPGDTGKASSDTYTDDDSIVYNRTFTYTCTGTYTGGTVSYTETLTTETVTSSDGDSCTLNSPQPNLQISGSYTSQHVFSGKATFATTPDSAYTCSQVGGTYHESGNDGTWTGAVTIA